MAYIQPGSNAYNACSTFCPPTGRLPILGKVRAEIDQIRWSITDTLEGIRDRERNTDDKINRTQQEMSALYSKNQAENQLLNQKAVTELAQTSEYLPNGMGRNTSTSVAGVIDKQKGLFQKQTDGFDRDAEQKLSKIMVDTWSVRQTTDGEPSASAGVDNAEISRVLTKAKSGINY